jgi:hypothetical protein
MPAVPIVEIRRHVIRGVILVFFVVGCRSADPPKERRSTPFQKHVSVRLVADKDLSLMDETEITCVYSIDYPVDRSDTLTWYVNGYFRDPAPGFSILSGDTSWVDTVKSYVEVEHTINVRALDQGRFIIEAFVSTPLDSNHVLGNNETISINVR